MKRNTKKLLGLTVILMMMVPAVINAQTGKADFSGDWTLNAEKSTQPQGGMGGGARMGGGNFVATQDGNVLTVVRSRTGQDGTQSTTTMKYTLDGKESINASPRGDSKSIAKWSADGKSLTIETSRTMEMNGESMTMKSSEVWSLSDPKTLAVNTTREGMNGEVKSNMIYEKK